VLSVEPINKAYRFKTKSEDYVYLGDPADAEFHPKIKLERWAGECHLRIAFDDSKVKQRQCRCEQNKVKWETRDFDFHFYPVEPRTVVMKHPQTGEDISFLQNELDGLEFEIILKKKPTTNQIALAIETKGLKFYYQPPLHPDHPTWADTDGDGIADTFRPMNAVGSYAVYHAARTNMHRSREDAEKYRVGKAFHIYRPKAVDAEGKEAWCDLHVDETKGLLMVTIPQEFLDSAVYPVSVDPTFGYETKGSSFAGASSARIGGSWATGGVGTATSISVCYHQFLSFYPNVKHALYEKTGDLTGNLVAGSGTEEWTVTDGYDDWKTLNCLTPPEISAVDYWIVLFSEPYAYVYYDDGGTNDAGWQAEDYNGFPLSISLSGESRIYSIYCTYTAEAVEQYKNFYDSGSAVESVTVQAQISISEAGSALETPAVEASIPVTDSGSGVDSVPSIQIPIQDIGTGIDAPTVQAEVSIPDSGLGTEIPTVEAQIPVSDQGQSVETPSLETQISVADQGQAVDLISSIEIPIQDSGLGIDQPAVEANIPVQESGVGAETPLIQAEIPISDLGSAVELSTIEGLIQVSDQGLGIDLPSLAIGILVSDSGVGTDTIPHIEVPVQDQGSGVEVSTVEANIPVIDQASGIDLPIIIARILAQDTGSGVDTGYAGTLQLIQDSGVGSETIQILANILAEDSGTSYEVAEKELKMTLEELYNMIVEIQKDIEDLQEDANLLKKPKARFTV